MPNLEQQLQKIASVKTEDGLKVSEVTRTLSHDELDAAREAFSEISFRIGHPHVFESAFQLFVSKLGSNTPYGIEVALRVLEKNLNRRYIPIWSFSSSVSNLAQVFLEFPETEEIFWSLDRHIQDQFLNDFSVKLIKSYLLLYSIYPEFEYISHDVDDEFTPSANKPEKTIDMIKKIYQPENLLNHTISSIEAYIASLEDFYAGETIQIPYALMKIYGEDRVREVFNSVEEAQEPIDYPTLILLVRYWGQYKEYPVNWTLKLIGSGTT